MKDFVVPKQWAKDALHPTKRPYQGKGARGNASVAKVVAERNLEAGMDHVHAATRLPDGSIRVWGEASSIRPRTNLRAFNDGWERAFGGAE